ncbi:MAG: MBL fold metallo-hydrolase [Gammaproteobacteria bacterium]|nr:MBL fold metallo-hydrolase [Gammaproteobacteria bacterium]
MMLASLGSGSKGNATLVRCENTCVLIDCGYSLLQFEKRMQNFSISANEISAILVTHEHSDHGAGILKLARKYSIPIWTTVGTARALSLDEYQVISGGVEYSIGDDLKVLAVTVPHDAAEPVQFVFTQISSGRKLGVLTDTGHITAHMKQAYDGLHGLLLEFNYDEVMLQNGPYPPGLKRRISGLRGHLSNTQSLDMLQQIDTSQLDCLIAGHISEKNNSVDIVDGLLQQEDRQYVPVLASQQQGFEWVQI